MCNKDESKLLKDESEFPREKSCERSFKANDRSRAELWEEATCVQKASEGGWNITCRGHEKMVKAN